MESTKKGNGILFKDKHELLNKDSLPRETNLNSTYLLMKPDIQITADG